MSDTPDILAKRAQEFATTLAEYHDEAPFPTTGGSLCKEAAKILTLLSEAVETLTREREQLYHRLTCMCGGETDKHNIGDGHSPVPMYDYALDQAEARAEAAEARLAEVERERVELLNKLTRLAEECARASKREGGMRG